LNMRIAIMGEKLFLSNWGYLYVFIFHSIYIIY